MCSTLGKMIEQGRYKKRYVVATREDAKFKIHRIKDNNIRKSDEVLDVCQNCLEELRYKGFSMQMGTDGRRTAVSGFSLAMFFDELRGRLRSIMPIWRDTRSITSRADVP